MTPDAHTIQELMIDVGDGHTLYVQEWGNPNGTPVIYLHGGPGEGVKNSDRKKFDPLTQRVIFYDQRGAGKSLPTRSLDNNATPKLVEDIEKIIVRLNLTHVLLCGGSWGSTLALAFAIQYPHRVQGLVIYGVYIPTPRSEADWLDTGGWRHFFPEVWDQYTSSIPREHIHNPGKYLRQRVFGTNQEAAKKAAYTFETMELALLKLDEKYLPADYDLYDPGMIKTEMHFSDNHFFMEDNHILNNAHKLTMPVHIVQGRYDMVCRPSDAKKLSDSLPISTLTWTINGHINQHEARTVVRLLLRQLCETATA